MTHPLSRDTDKGSKHRSGQTTLALSGAQKWAELLRNPVRSNNWSPWTHFT